LPLILEHDRGTEQQQHFRRRIGAYRALLQAGGQTQLFGVEAVTVAFTTFVSYHRIVQMRDWTRTAGPIGVAALAVRAALVDACS